MKEREKVYIMISDIYACIYFKWNIAQNYMYILCYAKLYYCHFILNVCFNCLNFPRGGGGVNKN